MVGATLKHVREKKGLTQRATAKLFGISDVHLCNIERGKVRPSVSLIDRISKEWNVDIYILSWCLNSDSDSLPPRIRAPMEQLAEAWRLELAGR